ncbi:stress responsive A/B barrel domain-containing protein [Seiridium cupressi]
MGLTHIVMYQVKLASTPEMVKELIDRMFALKQTCLHANSGKPYILSTTGGRDNSVQGLQGGLTHAFVVTFSNEEDRNYYALEDPVHLDFVKWSEDVVEKVVAVDFAS